MMRSIRTLFTAAALAIALVGLAPLGAGAGHHEAGENPCAAKAANPCAAKGGAAANPCAAKAAPPAKQANPCAPKAANPCGEKGAAAANPCAGRTPAAPGRTPSKSY